MTYIRYRDLLEVLHIGLSPLISFEGADPKQISILFFNPICADCAYGCAHESYWNLPDSIRSIFSNTYIHTCPYIHGLHLGSFSIHFDRSFG